MIDVTYKKPWEECYVVDRENGMEVAVPVVEIDNLIDKLEHIKWLDKQHQSTWMGVPSLLQPLPTLTVAGLGMDDSDDV